MVGLIVSLTSISFLTFAEPGQVEPLRNLSRICDPIIEGRWNDAKRVLKEIGSFKDPKNVRVAQSVIATLCQYASASDRYANALTGIRMVHELGADASGENNRAMATCAMMDHWGQMTERLIQYGVSPNGLCGGNDGSKGLRPLVFSCIYNLKPVAAEVLLKHGADSNRFNLVGKYGTLPSEGNTMTYLMIASSEGKPDFIPVLLKYKAKVNLTCPENGMTALHYAAKWNRGEVIQKLLKAGADKSKRNKKGETPLQVAQKSKATNAIKLLK